jgi:hypothetical protein
MKKIPSVFVRHHDGDRRLLDQILPESAWVVAGEGTATRKWDGTACLVKGGRLYKRYDAKQGKAPPEGFEPCQEPDPVTGHWPGWVPVGAGPEDRWFHDADKPALDGTYELCGPKIGGKHGANPERFGTHRYIRHGDELLADVPRTFQGLKQYLGDHPMEGIVFHHPDGRMAKIKRSDFGLRWPDEEQVRR